MGYILGATVEYKYIPCICIMIPIISIIIFINLPNTPRYYLQKGQEKVRLHSKITFYSISLFKKL